jgi:hypothetical protein
MDGPGRPIWAGPWAISVSRRNTQNVRVFDVHGNGVLCVMVSRRLFFKISVVRGLSQRSQVTKLCKQIVVGLHSGFLAISFPFFLSFCLNFLINYYVLVSMLAIFKENLLRSIIGSTDSFSPRRRFRGQRMAMVTD